MTFWHFAKNPYLNPEAFTDFDCFDHHWHQWTPPIGSSGFCHQNPYLIPGAFAKIDCFSCFSCQKWCFSECQVCRWHFSDFRQKRWFWHFSWHILHFLHKPMGKPDTSQTVKTTSKPVVSEKTTKNSDFREKCQKWHFRENLWGLSRDFGRKWPFLTVRFWPLILDILLF